MKGGREMPAVVNVGSAHSRRRGAHEEGGGRARGATGRAGAGGAYERAAPPLFLSLVPPPPPRAPPGAPEAPNVVIGAAAGVRATAIQRLQEVLLINLFILGGLGTPRRHFGHFGSRHSDYRDCLFIDMQDERSCKSNLF